MTDFSNAIVGPGFALTGQALVEASAGTGKTYNIQSIYLRLVLQDGLAVEQILVVTFTNAATHELRERLRKVLRLALAYLEGRLTKDDEEFSRAEDIVGAARANNATDDELMDRLRVALMNFDNAAISTIHGFCQHVLESFSFECGHDPVAKLLQDTALLEESICRDWWRQNTYSDADFRRNIVFEKVAELQAYLHEYLKRPDATLAPRPESVDDWKNLQQRFMNAVNSFSMKQGDEPGRFCASNISARRIRDNYVPGIAEQIGESVPNQYLVSGLIKSWRKDMAKAEWELALSLPKALVGLQDAANGVWEKLGTLSGHIEWIAPCVLKKKKGDPIDTGHVRSAIDNHREEIRAWLDSKETPFQSGKKLQTLKTALAFLLDEELEWPGIGDAKPLCKHLKCIAQTSTASVLEQPRFSLGSFCPELFETARGIERKILSGMVQQLETLADEVHDRIRDQAVLTYTNMLRNVRDALRAETTDGALHASLREEFRAALVDEFQDTDPVQYEIFTRLFAGEDVPLYFVGDPKQAIYAFRGGDVFTYYSAKNNISDERKYDLKVNYRSENDLVAAINDLFRDREGTETFLRDAITYAGDLGAKGVSRDKALTSHNAPDTRPLKIWRYDAGGSELPGMTNHSTKRIYGELAEEIVSLLNDKTTRIAGKPVHARDIAVLVCTNDETALVHHAIRERNVHAVIYGQGNVFDTNEAREFAIVMAAMLDPSNPKSVRTALTTSLLPCTIQQLHTFCTEEGTGSIDTVGHSEEDKNGPPATFEAWMNIFREAGTRWRKRSFIEAFRLIVNRVGMKSHIIRLKNGERQLTNILHLAELVHKATSESHQGPVAAFAWLTRQLNKDTRDENDQYELRLSSDEDAVTIRTIHKSKGLEFPIVFVPTCWRKKAEAKPRDSKMLTYHAENRAVLDLDLNDEWAQSWAIREALEEHIRVIYVAVTRAKHRTYLFAIDATDTDSETYALANLLQERELEASDHIELFNKELTEDKAPVTRWKPNEGPAMALEAREKPNVDKSHGHTSFSGLEVSARDAVVTSARDIDAAEDETFPAMLEVAEDIFSIPGSARTGDCWHEILEEVDFQGNGEERTEIIDGLLDRYRICNGPTEKITRARRRAVHEMIEHTLNTGMCIDGQATPLKLNEIPMSARRSELAFNFSLAQHAGQRKTPIVKDVLVKHWQGNPEKKSFLAVLDSWDRKLPRGFLTGFIDLVCCHKDRFYILDWKSNKRSGRIDDFGPDGLRDEIARHSYFLQYLLYTVAVHGFLQNRLKDYDYEKHFGGIFYVFLRGVTGQQNDGIFTDRPSLELVQDLANVLAIGQGGAS